MSRDARDYARLALAGIRLVNGTTALLAPETFARRLGIDPDTQRGSLYAFRLFGVRTILIGAELLSSDSVTRTRALRAGIFIHTADAAAAAIGGATRQLPPRAAATAFVVSSTNAVLAALAGSHGRRPSHPGARAAPP